MKTFDQTFPKNLRVFIISPHFRYALDFYSVESRLLLRAGLAAMKCKFCQNRSASAFKKPF